ncbi:unnamed protein product, partial [Symbiodinium microadriaticum]
VITDPGSPDAWYAHQPLPDGHGHLYGVTYEDEHSMKIIDVSARARSLLMRTTNFVRFLQQDSQATWFCMDIVDYNALAEHGSVYDLAGAAKRSDDSLNTDKGYSSGRAIDWAQRELFWPEVMQECEEMWSVLPRRERVVELHGLKIDRPLDAALLKEYDHWWHVGAVPDMMDINKIHAISVDGHEKDGRVKMSHNGRFMVTDKATGVVFRVAEMLEPENSDVALKCLARTVDVYALLPTITKKAMHKQVGYWCIDKTHRFIVLLYARRHNALVLENQATYLNPFSANRKTMKKAQIHPHPASHARTCKKQILKKPAQKRPVFVPVLVGCPVVE